MQDEGKIVEAIDEIIIGKNVKRSVHNLILNGEDLSEVFCRSSRQCRIH